MRTSHKRIHQLIKDEKSKLTDQDIFSSRAYAAYLTDIAEASSGRYKRKVKVITTWNESLDAFVAYTNNKSIVLNCGNHITSDYPTCELKNLSLLGFVGHEEGHILYTDFTVLSMFMQAVDNGTMYPKIPSDLEDEEKDSLEKYLETLQEKDEKTNCIIKYVLHNIANILEDIHVEECICSDFPGSFKTGIRLNNVKLTEDSMSVSEQIEKELPNAAIITNTILQYARIGEFNNSGGYKGPVLDVFYDCIPLIDESVSKKDSKERYDSANRILIKMWPYVEEWIEQIKSDPSKTPEEVQAMLDKLAEELGGPSGAGGTAIPKGSGKGSKEKAKPDFSSRSDESREAREVLEEEGGRFELVKTDDIGEGSSGGVEYDNTFMGNGYKNVAEDIERLLMSVAEDKAMIRYNEELEKELQKEADGIRYGNAHRGIKVKVNRMHEVPENLRESYMQIAAPLQLISKRLQKQITSKLKAESEGGRMNGLYMGRHLNARALVSDDGKIFYNKKLPSDEPKLAVAVLNDESGSMSWGDRSTSARAASIVLYDFCNALGIPIAIYGHTEFETVEMYAYAEFDHPDKHDRYRLMDISAHSGNRDGAALRFVAERLVNRPEKIKLLIIISDGQPAACGYGGTEAEKDLRGIKQEYRNRGITMFAAAIGNDKPNIERIYKDGFLDITDLSKLPVQLTKLVLRYVKSA